MWPRDRTPPWSGFLAGDPKPTGVQEQFEELAGTIGEAAVSSGSVERLKAWWIFRLLMTPDPLSERLALMWHNHFATSQLKVDNVSLMFDQNQIFREHGRGKFGDLLRRVLKQPAMLVWLDADANRKQHPNENLAREVMELFTLGEGNYTQSDVKEAARALTGWTVSRNQFRGVPAYHDAKSKTLFGKTGPWDGDDLIELLVHHPATPRRIAWRLCHTFLGENQPDETAIKELADQLATSKLNIEAAVKTILKSRIFFAESNLHSQIQSPVDFVLGSLRALEQFDPPPSTLILAEHFARLGQDLFSPPNVFGWQGGRSWINTRSLLGRNNFVSDLIDGKLHRTAVPLQAWNLAKKYHATKNQETQLQFFIKLLTGRTADSAFVQQVEKQCANSSLSEEDVARTMVAAVLTRPIAQLG